MRLESLQSQKYNSCNFNPRTHEGCDAFIVAQRQPQMVISIHAPARGPTLKDLNGKEIDEISIHAPARGATVVLVCTEEKCITNFNPRTREGCDCSHLTPSNLQKSFQSTHPRGVRLSRMKIFCSKGTYFNPRTHEGCDAAELWGISPTTVFQSTHPRGVRLLWYHQRPDTQTISIHAPTRGATSAAYRFMLSLLNFNPRTHEGCDVMVLAALHRHKHFNPRTHEGCDVQPPANKIDYSDISIHAPTRGATKHLTIVVFVSMISIHAPTRGATLGVTLT